MEQPGKRRDFVDGLLEAGEYGRGPDGEWYGMPPGTDLLAGLAKHTVVEHEDGTITVSPSILVSRPHTNDRWHGFLERGVWRDV